MKPQFPTEQSDSGEFQRQEDAFREWISNDGSTLYPAEADRYHLYVSLACPWASRTIIFRKLKGLEDTIGMTIVDPFRDEKGWAFRDPERSRPGSALNKLDEIEKRLSKSRYLFGKRMAEADWRLFCTLIRFDAVYHGHFKCNLRRIIDYPNLQGYLLDLYQHPGIAETVSIDHIKRHYYMTHEEINPTRIVPLGPILDLTRSHGREKIG